MGFRSNPEILSAVQNFQMCRDPNRETCAGSAYSQVKTDCTCSTNLSNNWNDSRNASNGKCILGIRVQWSRACYIMLLVSLDSATLNRNDLPRNFAVGNHFRKHIFSSRIWEGISFFIMPPCCFALVCPLNFWQVFTSGRVNPKPAWLYRAGTFLK
jgi:hypothetical protein